MLDSFISVPHSIFGTLNFHLRVVNKQEDIHKLTLDFFKVDMVHYVCHYEKDPAADTSASGAFSFRQESPGKTYGTKCSER